jgi:hypothetical protein
MESPKTINSPRELANKQITISREIIEKIKTISLNEMMKLQWRTCET